MPVNLHEHRTKRCLKVTIMRQKIRMSVFIILLISLSCAWRSASGECALVDRSPYNKCSISPSDIRFCGGGKIGSKLIPCHGTSGKKGFCCQSGTHEGCKSGAKYQGKWYYYKGSNKWSYCKSIYLNQQSGAGSSGCVVTINSSNCPFFRSPLPAVSSVCSTSDGITACTNTSTYLKLTKLFTVNGGAAWVTGSEGGFLDPNRLPSSTTPSSIGLNNFDNGDDSGDYRDDEWGGFRFGSSTSGADEKTLFRTVVEESGTQSDNSYSNKNFTIETYFTNSPAGTCSNTTPCVRSDIATTLNAFPYHIPLASNIAGIITDLRATGKVVRFSDAACDGLGTDEQKESCCLNRRLFWEQICTAYKVSLVRKARNDRRCQSTVTSPTSLAPDSRCTYYSTTVTTTNPSLITTTYYDPEF